MAISVVFRPRDYTVQMHHEVLSRLQQAGRPAGFTTKG